MFGRLSHRGSPQICCAPDCSMSPFAGHHPASTNAMHLRSFSIGKSPDNGAYNVAKWGLLAWMWAKIGAFGMAPRSRYDPLKPPRPCRRSRRCRHGWKVHPELCDADYGRSFPPPTSEPTPTALTLEFSPKHGPNFGSILESFRAGSGLFKGGFPTPPKQSPSEGPPTTASRASRASTG